MKLGSEEGENTQALGPNSDEADRALFLLPVPYAEIERRAERRQAAPDNPLRLPPPALLGGRKAASAVLNRSTAHGSSESDASFIAHPIAFQYCGHLRSWWPRLFLL